MNFVRSLTINTNVFCYKTQNHHAIIKHLDQTNKSQLFYYFVLYVLINSILIITRF